MVGRRRAIDLLRGARWRCSVCTEEHQGLFDLGTPAPWHWGGPIDVEAESALRLDGDFLSHDLCVIGGRDFFVRGLIEIPVHGMEETFGYGCWSTLSRANFELYAKHPEGVVPERPWTGWFAADLRPFPDTVNAPCRVMPRPGMLPDIWLENAEHPLSVAQREGISPEQLLDIYKLHGHAPG